MLPILLGLKDNGRDELKKHFDVSIPLWGEIIDLMDWLIFSDTILLTLPFPEDFPPKHAHYWLMFLLGARTILNDLFAAGLPVRGAIDYGTFLVKDTCFAGQCIVDAYKLSGKIEMAACVLSIKATKHFESCGPENFRSQIEKALLMKYLVPLKDGEEHMQTVRVESFKQPEIHGKVMHAFWGNEKDISRSVRAKIENTEQWLEYLEMTKS